MEGTSVDIDIDKIIIERLEKAQLKVVNEGTLTVALDSEITEELQMEGNVRDLVRGIQNLRKESGLEVTDRIILKISGSQALKSAYTMFSDYIASETLAVKMLWTDAAEGFITVEAGEEMWSAKIEKA